MIKSICFIFIAIWSLHSSAEEVYRSNQQPKLLSVEIGDSDITFKPEAQFSVRFTKDIVGTRSMSKEQREELLGRIKVFYDPASARLKVETPKIVIGRVIARLEIGTFQPLAIRLRGDDGDVKILGSSLSASEIRLRDGDIEAHQVKVFGDSTFQTEDGDIQFFQPQLVGEVTARSTGDGKVRRLGEPAESSTNATDAGNLQLITRDGNITVY